MAEVESPEARPPAMARARRWIALGVALAAAGYAGYAVWRDLDGTRAALASFRWSLYVPVLLLTVVNYGLRYVKWAYLLRRVGVRVPPVANGWIFTTGLAMVITPGKAGELVKPWLVREATGATMLRTIPVLVAERATDGIAVVGLAALGVSTYYAEKAWLVAVVCAVIAAGIAALWSERLVFGGIGLVRRAVGDAVADRLEEPYRALRACLSAGPLLFTLTLSLIAWGAECVGYWLVFRGLGVEVTLDLATFLYAFGTFFGAPSPGGLGISDAFLVGSAQLWVPGLGEGQALAAAALIRVATLWFGVVLGALALLRVDAVIAAAQPQVAHRPSTTTR